jgi:hypothetical protein
MEAQDTHRDTTCGQQLLDFGPDVRIESLHAVDHRYGLHVVILPTVPSAVMD